MTTPTPAPSTPTPLAARRPEGGPERRRDGRRYVPRRKVCHFCVEKGAVLDYKNIELLRRYVSDRGRIEPRRRTGSCAKHQRALVRQVKRARLLALLPFTLDVPREGIPPR